MLIKLHPRYNPNAPPNDTENGEMEFCLIQNATHTTYFIEICTTIVSEREAKYNRNNGSAGQDSLILVIVEAREQIRSKNSAVTVNPS